MQDEKRNIETLVKKSLQKLKKQKQCVKKLKNLVEGWKESHKRRLEEYNSQTRIENMLKFKYEPFRPCTSWGSPERKGHSSDFKHHCSRTSNHSLVSRRANIGLEYFNVKSPKNMIPKEAQEGQKRKKHTADGIAEFIKEKRKQRNKKKKIEKAIELNSADKRLSQLIELEKTAKKLVKKNVKKKSIVLERNSTNIMNSAKGFTLKSGKHSDNKRVSEYPDKKKKSKKCKNSRGENIIERNTVIVEKVLKKLNENVPIIETYSISYDTTSELTEQKEIIMLRIKELSNRVSSFKALADNSLNFAVESGLKILSTIVNNKCYEEFNLLRLHTKEVSLKATLKDQINISNRSSKSISDCNSEHLFNIHSKTERTEKSINFYKTCTEYFKDPIRYSVVSILDPDKPEKTSIYSDLESSSISNLLLDQLIKVQSYSLEAANYTDFTEEGFIESQSFISDKTENQCQLKLRISSDSDEPTSINILENAPDNKPEEIENNESEVVEFDSTKISNSAFEEFKLLTETDNKTHLYDDKLTEEIFEGTVEWVLDDCICIGVYEEFKQKNHQLISNVTFIVYESFLKTNLESVLQFVKIICDMLSEDFMNFLKVFYSDFHFLQTLSQMQNNPSDLTLNFLSSSILKTISDKPSLSLPKFPSENLIKASQIHDQLLLAYTNQLLIKYKNVFAPPPWRFGKMVTSISMNGLFANLIEDTTTDCSIRSGLVPCLSLTTLDGRLDEDLLSLLRERGLAAMLSYDVMNLESQWTDYESEEMQVVIQLSNEILVNLITELTDFLN